MRLDDFNLVDNDTARGELRELLQRFNDVPARYPRTPIHEAFAHWARHTPDAIAVRQDDAAITYGELEVRSNRLAHLLRAHGVRAERFVGVMCDDGIDLATALLGILKAGGAYCPLDADMPYQRARYILDDTRAVALISRRRFIRRLNQLQWDCRDLTAIVCLDSGNILDDIEDSGEKMRREVWDYVGQTMFDDISGGGWQSSFTGEWLSREVMDDYGENARTKLAAEVGPHSAVLEIGCASGITMFRLAPSVATYLGTDLSPDILAWSKDEATRRGLANVTLQALPAHEISTVAPATFDLVIVNSVLQCFSGHNYLRRVIRDAVRLTRDGGAIFLGNVFDQDLKDAFLDELTAYRRAHPAARTKTDYSEELFINRAFLEDLTHDLPELASIECSPLLGTHESELSRFSFDAILRIDRTRTPQGSRYRRHKHQLDQRAVSEQPASALDNSSTADSLAYAIYTSGTSGRPKGVLVEHKSIARLVLRPSFVDLDASTRILMTGAVAFDASTFEIWGALANGGTLHRAPSKAILDPDEVRSRIAAWGITTMWVTATLFNQLVDADPTVFRGLKDLLVGGERLSPPHVAAVRRALPDVRVINGYGPTENTTFTTCHTVDDVSTADIPIGRPIAGTAVLILGAGDEPVPVGMPGEICAAGDGLARGYLNDPALTAARFRPHPWHATERIYRTGDRGRWRADGVVEYLGRTDDQVKLRGYRIEPAEIEHAIRGFAGVSDVAVVTIDSGVAGAGHELAAYIAGTADTAAVRGYLNTVLPDYMVPRHIVVVDRLPLTANGKLDRRALPRPEALRGRGAATTTDTERALAGIWREVLDANDIGATDNFFDLGGHSLKVTRVISLIQERLGVRAPLAAVFKSPTVRDLAAYLLNAAEFGVPLADQAMVTLSAGAVPLFALPSGTGDVFGYMPLAARLAGIRMHAFNFIVDESRLATYADLISSTEPAPYVLVGYSAGGNLAFHVALELERRGLAVAQVIMVDSGCRLRPYPYVDDEVKRAAAAFLDHETIRPYCSTPVLRDKVVQRIEGFYRFLASSVDDQRLDAGLHVIVGTGVPMQATYDDVLIADIGAWKDRTRGRFTIHQGDGDHQHMLIEPALATNAAILARLIAGAGS